MSKFEVCNRLSAHSFGVFDAASPEEAVDACCRDAGYKNAADCDEVTGTTGELMAARVDLVQIVNPFSAAIIERDISGTTQAEIDACAMLLGDDVLSDLEGADTPWEWLAAMVKALGPVEAGRIILGS